MSIFKKIAKGSMVLFIGIIASKFLSYIYRMVVARTLGAEQYGLLALGMAVVGSLNIFTTLGLKEGVKRYAAVFRAKKDLARVKGVIMTAFKLSIPASLIVTFLVFFSSDWIALNIFNEASVSLLLKIISFTLPFNIVLWTCLAVFYAYQRARLVAAIDKVFQSVVLVLLTIILVYLGFGVVGAAVALTLSIALSAVVAFIVMERNVFSIFGSKVKAIEITGELVRYSWPLAMSYFSWLIIRYTDTILLGYFKTALDVGIYNVALPTASLLLIAPNAIVHLFMPLLAQLHVQKRRVDFKSLNRMVSRWIFYLNMPLFFMLWFFAPPLIEMLFGPEFVPGALPMAILLFGYLAYSMMLSTSQSVLLALKRTKAVLAIDVTIMVSNVVLNYIMIPLYGINGSAIATATSFILGASIYAIYTYRVAKVHPFTSGHLRSFLSIVLSILVTSWAVHAIFAQIALLELIAATLMCGVIYFALLFVVRGFDKNDMELINSLMSALGVSKWIRL